MRERKEERKRGIEREQVKLRKHNTAENAEPKEMCRQWAEPKANKREFHRGIMLMIERAHCTLVASTPSPLSLKYLIRHFVIMESKIYMWLGSMAWLQWLCYLRLCCWLYALCCVCSSTTMVEQCEAPYCVYMRTEGLIEACTNAQSDRRSPQHSHSHIIDNAVRRECVDERLCTMELSRRP